MAALDFGMALARGMLPKAESAQKDLINLAGGRDIFKSEDWWNQQVDKQIKEGYRESQQKVGYLMPSGEYKPQAGTHTTYGRMSYGQFQPINYGSFGGIPFQPYYSPVYGYGGGVVARSTPIAPEGAVKNKTNTGPLYTTKTLQVYAKNAARKDYTAGELSDIEASAKRGAERAKAEAAKTKASRKRLSRGTGGLVGKARLPGEAPSTGLPALGEAGLGLTASVLGAEQKL